MELKNLDLECSSQQHLPVSSYCSPTNESHLTPVDITATFRSPYPGFLPCDQITSFSSSSFSFNSSIFFRGAPVPDSPSETDSSSGGGSEVSPADLFSVQVESILNGNYLMPGGATELKRLCQVCGDSASGSHYGVASCEACKAFFKRTVQGNIKYGCPGVNQCEITKHRRKSCQACRFQKCLQAGMMKEGVRRDHVRGGRQKYKFCTETGPRGSSASGSSRNKVISHLLLTEPAPLTANHDDSTHDISLSALLTLGDLLNRELLLLIGWAKLIPGFSSLSLADQISLIQNGWMEALLVGVVWRSLATEGEELIFAENLRLNKHQCQAVGLGGLYEVLRHLVVKYQVLNLSPEEAVMMKAMVLGNADTDSIDCPDTVQSFLDGLHEALQEYESCHGERHRVGRLLMSLPLLRQAADTVIQVFLRLHHHHHVPLHKLLLEMIEAKT